MVDPQAVEDADGEFVELVNHSTVAANLRGWQLVDSEDAAIRSRQDLWIAPGEYLVLARGTQAGVNSYVDADFWYGSLQWVNTAGYYNSIRPERQTQWISWHGATMSGAL
jgi:hypothetical protein